jgi:hypothetical protein
MRGSAKTILGAGGGQAALPGNAPGVGVDQTNIKQTSVAQWYLLDRAAAT